MLTYGFTPMFILFAWFEETDVNQNDAIDIAMVRTYRAWFRIARKLAH